jgi:hypothetical protein
MGVGLLPRGLVAWRGAPGTKTRKGNCSPRWTHKGKLFRARGIDKRGCKPYFVRTEANNPEAFPMRLNVTDPRQMLIIRMQAWTYENVTQCKYGLAQREAEIALEHFDYVMEHNLTGGAEYWAAHYFGRFKDACQK